MEARVVAEGIQSFGVVAPGTSQNYESKLKEFTFTEGPPLIPQCL